MNSSGAGVPDSVASMPRRIAGTISAGIGHALAVAELGRLGPADAGERSRAAPAEPRRCRRGIPTGTDLHPEDAPHRVGDVEGYAWRILGTEQRSTFRCRALGGMGGRDGPDRAPSTISTDAGLNTRLSGHRRRRLGPQQVGSEL